MFLISFSYFWYKNDDQWIARRATALQVPSSISYYIVGKVQSIFHLFGSDKNKYQASLREIKYF